MNEAQPVAAPRPRVLIVDRCSESIEVLQTILRRRGVDSWGARRVQQGLDLARATSPELIVVDDDCWRQNEGICDDFADSNAHLVVLGKLTKRPDGTPPAEEVAKPYHYSDLIRKIEELLRSTRAA